MSFLSALFARFRSSSSSLPDAPAQASRPRGGDKALRADRGPHKAVELKDLQAEWVVIGLGNPGAKYAATRHNIGYWPVDALLEECQDRQQGVQWTPLRGVKAQVAQVAVPKPARPGASATRRAKGSADRVAADGVVADGVDADSVVTDGVDADAGTVNVVLVRSTTYMNESGEAVAPITAALGVPADHVIVLHDELDIAKGQVRIKAKGGEGGHNGLRSMTAQLGTQEYVRVRMGIGRPPQGVPVIDYVLSPFEDGDLDSASGWMDTSLKDAADAVRLIVAHGPDIARNDIHTRHK